MIKNLNITERTKKEDKLEDEPELSHAISINEVNVYIAECLLLFMLTTIFLAIYKKIIGKEEYFTKNIEARIQQICLLTIDYPNRKSFGKTIIALSHDKDESCHCITYKFSNYNQYKFSGYNQYCNNWRDNINKTIIFNTLNSLIESGCSSNI